ncbi:hypothetical protein SVIO_085410 [Streptomyces violaceusniger]|uniref:Metallo-beta-lactamase domain-containing protein n=2 Tax=Streptomyces violaceusniger TaxID=68280 RepID=A0A4D4LHF8_STRVO|nr:hypothetical protein SVIO_085410 [Streptomyces violaceusniger]
MLPIHWGTFNLAPHPWEEPAEGTVRAAKEAGATVAVPRPGQPFEPEHGLPLEPWWRAIAARPVTELPAAAEGAAEPAVPAGPSGAGASGATGKRPGATGGADPAMPIPQS